MPNFINTDAHPFASFWSAADLFTLRFEGPPLSRRNDEPNTQKSGLDRLLVQLWAPRGRNPCPRC
jgi:hypothetical protein